MTSSMPELKKSIVTVRDLLSDSTLSIPPYQRPYKWTSINISQLFDDIVIHSDKSAYRLGTIVLHQAPEEPDKKNIVDGQQRTITIILAVRALLAERAAELQRDDLRKQLEDLQDKMINPLFPSNISKVNIHSNYFEILRYVSRAGFTENHIDFFLNKCQFVTFTLTEISEAFQFFDSQNARGRDLEPHDLLKAFHLREFSDADEPVKAITVSTWEETETEQLSELFSQYLFRIRNWSKGKSARYFGKEDTPLFKGVNFDSMAKKYPYMEPLRMAHYYADHYNQNLERNITDHTQPFPFQLDQIIINGRRFFEMITHYLTRVSRISDLKTTQFDGFTSRVLAAIDTYEGRHRTGDRYVRSIFDCLLIYYIDKFGMDGLSRAIEKIFIWAYSLRMKMEVVQLATMDNYVLSNNLFQIIKDATRPTDFTACSLPIQKGNRSSKTERIETLFREMKYYEPV